MTHFKNYITGGGGGFLRKSNILFRKAVETNPHKLEAEWSLLILDLDFKVKGEVLFSRQGV